MSAYDEKKQAAVENFHKVKAAYDAAVRAHVPPEGVVKFYDVDIIGESHRALMAAYAGLREAYKE